MGEIHELFVLALSLVWFAGRLANGSLWQKSLAIANAMAWCHSGPPSCVRLSEHILFAGVFLVNQSVREETKGSFVEGRFWRMYPRSGYCTVVPFCCTCVLVIMLSFRFLGVQHPFANCVRNCWGETSAERNWSEKIPQNSAKFPARIPWQKTRETSQTSFCRGAGEKQFLTKAFIHWMHCPHSLKRRLSSLISASSHPLPQTPFQAMKPRACFIALCSDKMGVLGTILSSTHPSRDVIFFGQISAKKKARNYFCTWRLRAFKTSTFGITWCDNF